jgi:predicted RNA-binding Zn ribbon-like protein
MSTEIIDSALRERFGSISLDFVNTIVVSRSGPVDALAGAGGVEAWMERAPTPAWEDLRPRGVTERRVLHAEALRLRVVIDTLLSDVASGRAVGLATIFALNRVLGWTRASSRAAVGEHGAYALVSRYEGLHPAASLAPIAEDAVRLVGSVHQGRLRRCRADACLRWFVDTSKGGRRAWCSMATCGNRAKAARYRARHDGDVDAA